MADPEKAPWQPMATCPKDGSPFLVKLSNGSQAWAEWWEGPPGLEDEWGGLAVCMTQSFVDGTLKSDCDAEATGWRPSPEGEANG